MDKSAQIAAKACLFRVCVYESKYDKNVAFCPQKDGQDLDWSYWLMRKNKIGGILFVINASEMCSFMNGDKFQTPTLDGTIARFEGLPLPLQRLA